MWQKVKFVLLLNTRTLMLEVSEDPCSKWKKQAPEVGTGLWMNANVAARLN